MTDQPKQPVETPRAWLRYAENELGVAARELEQKHLPIRRFAFCARAQPKSF